MDIKQFPDLIIDKIKEYVFDRNYNNEEKKNFCLLSKKNYNIIKGEESSINNIKYNALLNKNYHEFKIYKNRKNKYIDLFSIKFGTYGLIYVHKINEEYINFNIEIIDSFLKDKRINNIIFKRFFILKHMEINFKGYKNNKSKYVYCNKSKEYKKVLEKILKFLDINIIIPNKISFNYYINFLENLDMINIFKLSFMNHKNYRFYNFDVLKFSVRQFPEGSMDIQRTQCPSACNNTDREPNELINKS